MFAIIDIETCGGKFDYRRGRIIEISVLLHDGLTVTDKFTTLINPECHISPAFRNITGITDEMVADAPRFCEVAKKLVELTENRIFVGHNVQFDYGFIRDEFAHLGYRYRRDTLCTVRLSRKLIPSKISYSLGKLCASLNIPVEGRHRAEGDATATAKLLDHLIYLKSVNPQYKNMGIEEIMTRRVDKIKAYILKKIPEDCGVYYFLDRDGKILYIGKSSNMYNRAISHFNTKGSKQGKLLFELTDVNFIPTGSELIALLTESAEIKNHKPPYNKVRKSDAFTHSIYWQKDEQGIVNFKIAPYGEQKDVLRSFNSLFTARECLDRWIDEHTLCIRYCGLTDSDAVCFNHHIKKCNGICAGKENPETYNARANEIIKQFGYKYKSFCILDKGRRPEEQSVIVVEDGHYKGFGYFDASTQFASPSGLAEIAGRSRFYPDSDDLLRSWIKSRKPKIIKLTGEQV